ncbi:MAG: type II toxin-antitoxin system Phd/YefM family antitoxin [Thiohalomonadales bacterium]
MSKEIGAYDAKTKLPEILRRVEAGESFTITNRGRAVADLVPSRAASKQKAIQAVANLLEKPKVQITADVLKQLREIGRA